MERFVDKILWLFGDVIFRVMLELIIIIISFFLKEDRSDLWHEVMSFFLKTSFLLLREVV